MRVHELSTRMRRHEVCCVKVRWNNAKNETSNSIFKEDISFTIVSSYSTNYGFTVP